MNFIELSNNHFINLHHIVRIVKEAGTWNLYLLDGSVIPLNAQMRSILVSTLGITFTN